MHTTLESVIQEIPLSTSERKTLLTPSSANPGLIKRAIALKAGKVANLSVLPFRRFVVERSLDAFREKEYVSGERLFWLLFSLLQPMADELHFFRDATIFHGLAEIAIATIAELRLNGITGEDLLTLQAREKWTDILKIQERYEEIKKERGLYDYPDAVDALLAEHRDTSECFLIRHPLSSREEQLIASMNIRIIDPEPDASHSTLSGYRVDTPYQEILQTIRNVVDDMRPATRPTRIGICTPSYGDAYQLLAPVLSAQDLSSLIEFADGEPLVATAPGLLWFTFVEWVSHDYSAARFVRILESGGFDRDGADAVTFYRAVRYIRNSGLGLFNGEFAGAFRAYASGRRTTDEDLDPTAADAVAIALRLVDRFHTIVTEDNPLSRFVAFTDVFLESIRITSDKDAEAIAHIESVIGMITEAEPRGMRFQDILTIVGTRLSTRRVNRTLPGFAKPVLGTREDLQWCEFDTLYVLGMNERAMPRKTFQNPLLLDDEKRMLRDRLPGVHFQLLEDVLDEDKRQFDLLISTTRGELVFSAPVRDLHSGREMLVSPYLLNEWNNRYGTRDDFRAIARRLQDDHRSQNNYVPGVPEDSFFVFEHAVAALLRSGGMPRGMLAGHFPFAGSIVGFREGRRTASEFDRYWGVVRPPPLYELPVMSASKIVMWTRCPYQYLLRYVFFLESNEEYDRSILDWLDPLAYGNFLHTLYYRFLLRLREEKGNWFTSVDRSDKALMREEFESVLREFRVSYPVNSQVHFELQCEQLRRDADLFVDHEQDNSQRRVFVELSFNMPSTATREPLLQKADPARVRLNDGAEIFVRGAIDRVDQDATGRSILTDYKTGSARRAKGYAAEGKKIFGGGELIQAGLYSEIIGQADASLTDPLFRFYFATEHQDFYEYVVDYPVHREHFLALLTAVCDEIRKGHFVPAGQDATSPPCNFCDYTSVCIEGRQQAARRLRFSDANAERHDHLRNEEVS